MKTQADHVSGLCSQPDLLAPAKQPPLSSELVKHSLNQLPTLAKEKAKQILQN